jgi:anti-sigma B factor antagonist
MSDQSAAANRLTIHVEYLPDAALVRCHGELVAGVTDVLYREVRPLFPDTKRIVLDFKELTYLDSMGLGTILRLYVSAKSSGCSVELANIGARVRQILGITNLISVLTVIGENHIRLGARAATGGLIGALVGMGMPEYEAKRYEGRLKEGGILVSVHCDNSDWVSKAKDILERAGAQDIASAGEKAVSSHTVAS